MSYLSKYLSEEIILIMNISYGIILLLSSSALFYMAVTESSLRIYQYIAKGYEKLWGKYNHIACASTAAVTFIYSICVLIGIAPVF